MGKIAFLRALEFSGGDFLSDYRIIKILGRGLTSVTYHVASKGTGKEFVLKSFPISPEFSLEWLDSFEAQTVLLSKLTHLHIDRIVHSGKSGNVYFSIKDFFHNGEGDSCNLRDYIRKHGGSLSHHQVYHIISQVLNALVYALRYEDNFHRSVSHGNLKPENILISIDCDRNASSSSKVPFEVRVSDFQPYGLIDEKVILACYSERVDLLKDDDELTEILEGMYRSFDYRSPEKEEGRAPSPQEDVYAIGAIIYEMITGKLPCGHFPMPSSLRPSLPLFWDDVVGKCLQASPDRRYDSCLDLLNDLSENLGVEEDLAKEVFPFSIPSKKKERKSLTPPGMAYIPAGNFFVGCVDCGDDALPQHETFSQGFYLDRNLVTNAQFRYFVEETGYLTEAEKGKGAPIWDGGKWKVLPGISWKNPLGNPLQEDFERHPVVQVTYVDVLSYAEWMGHRLPTEYEWEYAARGGQKEIKYPWGNMITRSDANYSSDGTTSIMAYRSNGYGLYDMAGNVWEWTSSFYQAYPGNTRYNPHFGEKYRVVRGGAWMYDGYHCMVSYRNANQAEHCYPTLGFRTAYDFVEES